MGHGCSTSGPIYLATCRISFGRSASYEESPTIISNSPGPTAYFMFTSQNDSGPGVKSSPTVAVSPGLSQASWKPGSQDFHVVSRQLTNILPLPSAGDLSAFDPRSRPPDALGKAFAGTKNRDFSPLKRTALGAAMIRGRHSPDGHAKAMLTGPVRDYSVFSGQSARHGQEENSLAIERDNIGRPRAVGKGLPDPIVMRFTLKV